MNKENIKDYIAASATVYPVFKKEKLLINIILMVGFMIIFPSIFNRYGLLEIIAVYTGLFGILQKLKEMIFQ